MFNKQNFCHVASNNRNEQKAGLFVYKTTDDLATVATSGYFNEKIIDINLHDLIIHEWHDPTDKTKVQRNVLCVVERTLDNVGTIVIKSKWEGDIEETIAQIQQYIEDTFVKKDGSSVMTGPLKFSAGSMRGAIAGGLNGLTFFKMDSEGNLTQIGSLSDTQFVPGADNTLDIGTSVRKVERIYVGKLNNGHDIDVPATTTDDTLGLKSQIDDAANSGEQLYTTGVWYAKMYSATTVPTGAEYEGRNYADFSQVDSNNDPIIVVYTYTSGAWAQTTVINPPKNHNGYMTITSKIWDIAEQTGQQGGLVLWSHNQETFTPYPRIISFENAALTGVSTAPTPTSSSPDNQIATKEYVDNISLPARSINANVFGTVAISDNGDVSGLPSGNALTNIFLNFAKQPFEFIYAITTPTSLSSGSYAAIMANAYTKRMQINLNPNNNIEFSMLNSSGTPIGSTLTTPWVANTKYYVKITYDGTNTYTAYVSTDGTNYTSFGTIIDNSFVLDSIGYKISLGESGTNTIIHMGEMSLTVNGVQVYSGLDAPSLHSKSDLDFGNTKMIDYVVAKQDPTAFNNYTWYRKYKSGWVEQGGRCHSTSSVTLPVVMADTNYNIQITGSGMTANNLVTIFGYDNITKYGFDFVGLTIQSNGTIGASTSNNRSWEVKGIAA